MKYKLKQYFIALLILYILAIIIKNTFDTDTFDGDLTKISFSSVEKCDFGILPKFDLKAISTNPKHGEIYILSKCTNCPSEIHTNKEYNVYLKKFRAHSWLDFFKFGTKYDYKIYKFANNNNN
jgi:hypothetical protein